MKTVSELLKDISLVMEKNKISGFSAFADDEHVGCQMMGFPSDILTCLSALIQDMVSNMGEANTISAANYKELHGSEEDEQ